MKIVREDNGNILLVLKECVPVSQIKANDVDASFEKHVPQMKKIDNNVEVFVNHVMEEDHYIEWILVDYGNEQIIKHFVPFEDPRMIVEWREGMIAYSYCNKHGLWKCDEILK